MNRTAILIVAILATAAAIKNYQGHKIYKVQPKTEVENALLTGFQHSNLVTFWSKLNKVGKPVYLSAAPAIQQNLEDFLHSKKIQFSVGDADLEELVQKERLHHASKHIGKGRISFDRYYRHAEINEYLEQLAADHPDLVTIEQIGQSYEKRDMKLVRISTGSANPAKPAIFIDAGIHAREWIAPAVALYTINQLVENPEHANMVENVDWIILPSLNPDGYEYSWDEDRFWRKTVSPGDLCNGTDANRNFDFHWMESGADSWECSEIFAGPEAFSEVEARNLRDFILNNDNIAAYLTLHSYGQYLLYPWGYDSDLPDNWQELDALGHRVNDAIEAVRGTEYTVGSSTNVLYAAAGASDDWSMGVGGIDIVYTIELPGGGFGGFDLPPSEITPVVEETFEGFKVFHDYLLEKRRQ